MLVRWHEAKNRANKKKHKIAFEEAQIVLTDPLSSTIDDPDHSWYERRYLTIGETTTGRLIVVSHTIEDDETWIINARKATAPERRDYEG